MPITLNPVTGELDATVVDDNFGELESFLKEGAKDDDFNGRFTKYNIRRHTGGKIVAFNSGTNRHAPVDSSSKIGTFENNWISGAPEISFVDMEGDSLERAAGRVVSSESGGTDGFYEGKSDMDYAHALQHPFELLGFPGGSLYYDFQEQGFSDPASYYDANTSLTVANWPPDDSLTVKYPDNECWSRWLTIPDAAGGVYVDEPCVAIITAQVTGNYFFTPSMRVHGTNLGIGGAGMSVPSPVVTKEGGPSVNVVGLICAGAGGFYTTEVDTESTTIEGLKLFKDMLEGTQNSASIRLGLFVDTNPVVWADEFPNDGADTSGFNPWIGDDADGSTSATRKSGVAEYRSWKKVTDISMRVRQRGTYKVIGAVELKGRRRYNFSLKFRPAMTFGHVEYSGPGSVKFTTGYYELSESAAHMPMTNSDWITFEDIKSNPAWTWGNTGSGPGMRSPDPTYSQGYFYPGGDALVTNLIESSSLSVEFFYGQKLTEIGGTDPVTIEPNVNPHIPPVAGSN